MTTDPLPADRPTAENLRATALPPPWREIQNASPQQILELAFATFAPAIAVTSSFQTQSLPLLHMVSQCCPEIPVFFIDTGFHFPATLAFRDRIVAKLDLNLRLIRAQDSAADLGPRPYKRDPDLCCYRNKIEPFLEARKGLTAWVSGIRKAQTPERSTTPLADQLDDGTYKICPLVDWSDSNIEAYISKHALPRHPLDAEGYTSIGCEPCTQRTCPGEDARAGRWRGSTRTECGLHLPTRSKVEK